MVSYTAVYFSGQERVSLPSKETKIVIKPNGPARLVFPPGSLEALEKSKISVPSPLDYQNSTSAHRLQLKPLVSKEQAP
jgi:hypothetical protein